MNLRFWNFDKKTRQKPKKIFKSKVGLLVSKNLEYNTIVNFIRNNHIRILASLILIVFAISGLVSLLQAIIKQNSQTAQASGNPTISSITPNSGSPVGGTNVTINGTNFAQGVPQRIVTITNPGSTITNYEGNITIDTASLITAGKLRSDCGDIRIKDSDGNTDLSYWIDGQCNSVSTVIWFKKPSLPAGNSTVIFQYARPDLSSQSNIANFSFGGVLTSNNNRLWLSANSGVGTSTDGTAIQTWTDRSGNNNNATQAIAGNRPILKNNIQNGKPVIRFVQNGVTQGFTFPTTSLKETFLVFNHPTGSSPRFSADYETVVLGDGANSPFHGNTGSGLVGCSWASASLCGGSALVNGSSQAITAITKSTNFRNVNFNLSSNVNVSNIALGHGLSRAMNGDVPEILVFNTSLSTQDRQSVETYLNRKYNLYGSNPTISVAAESGLIGGITFGGNPATNIEFISSTEFRVTVPASTLPGDKTGSVDVVVTNPDNSSVTLTNGFIYSAPVISSITPNTGATLGDYEVTINGANFVNSNYKRTVTLNNTGGVLTNAKSSISLDTSSLISAGKMRSDCGDIRVQNNDESQDLDYWIEYGCNTTNTLIHFNIPTLNIGSNTFYIKYGDLALTTLSNRDVVYPAINANAASLRQWIKATDGPSTTTSGATVSSVLDTSGNSNNWNLQGGFSGATYNPTGINGKPSLSFNGSNSYQFANRLTDIRTVIMFWNETAAGSGAGSFILGDTSSYDFHRNGNNYFGCCQSGNITNGTFRINGASVAPAAAQAVYNSPVILSMTTSGNVSANTFNKDRNAHGPFIGQFGESMIFNQALSANDIANIESYISAKYNLNSNLTVTVGSESGSGFGSITFGGSAATGVQYISSTQFRVTVPASTLPGDKTGSVNVVVTNPDGVSGTLTNGFTYSAPVITSITPNTGATLGGYEVTINGANFANSGYKRTVTLNNTGATLTDYQVNFSLDTASLVAAGKMKNDCGDIRVFDTNGATALNYWVESGCNTTSTSIWVRVPSLPTGSKNIFIEYGDSALSSLSSLVNTLPVLASSSNRAWLSSLDFTLASGATISNWTDRTALPEFGGDGIAHNFTQATVSKYPTYQTSVLNGKPVVNFTSSSGQTLVNSTNFASPYTIVYLSRQTGGLNQRVLSGLGDNFLAGYWNVGRDQMFDDATIRLSGGNPISDTAWRIYTASGNSSIAKLWNNGTEVASAGGNWSGPNGISLNGQQGTSEFSDAQIAEVLVFNTYLSDSDRNSVQNYLNQKFGVHGTLPTITVGSESGSGFGSITFGGNAATNIQYISSTQFRVTVPASTLPGNKTGSVNVVVTNPDTLSGALTNGFTYAAPVVSSISPNSGPDSGGTFVTITGANFSNLRASGTLISRYISINNPTGLTITNYEGNITLDTASLITAGKLRNDCGDIRVKDSDGSTDLNYWIDGDCNSSNTVVWFKKPSLPAGTNTAVLKYGDSGLTSQSNINNFSFGSVLTSSNNKLWLSANSGVGTSTDGTAIQTWTDRSGNNNNATQATAGNRPILKNNIQNGKPVVRFDGVNDTMSVASNIGLNFGNGGYSYLFVNKISGFAVNNEYGIINKNATFQNSAGWGSEYSTWGGGGTMLNLGSYNTAQTTWGNSNVYTGAFTPANQRVYTTIRSGSDLSLYTNGALSQTKNHANTALSVDNAQPIQIAKHSWGPNLNGDIPEILVFSTTISTQDRQNVETYLNTKYNLYGSNPSVAMGAEANYSIAINGQLIGNTKFIDSTTITGYIPAGTGTQNITVTNSDGLNGISSNGFTYGVNGVPNPIFDLSITNNESENVPLSWTAPYDNGSAITDYVIKYSGDNFATETVVSDGVNTNTSYTITGLTPGNSYQFKVITVNGIGNSVDSNIVSVGSLDCDINMNGADFTPANSATLNGRYCNVGTFTVSNGFTVNIATGYKFKMYAQNANILGTLNANSAGFLGGLQPGNTSGSGLGPGAGITISGPNGGGGGAYGGNGGRSSVTTGGLAYGSITEPTDLGSGGATHANNISYQGGNGGGAIKLNITNTLTNNGTITANGGSHANYGGGGSGGSIWITTNTLAGSGTITANGGNNPNGSNGGGSGGRIALYYQTKTLSGSVTASGGTSGTQGGGAGTIYEKSTSQTYGTLRINQNNISGSGFPTTSIDSTNLGLSSLDILVVTNKSNVVLNKDLNILNTSLDINTGTIFTVNNTLTSNSLTNLTNSGTFNFSNLGNWVSGNISDITLSGLFTLTNYNLPTINNFTIQSGGNLTTIQNTTVANTPYKKIDLNINNLTINSGGQIQTNGRGFLGGMQTGNTSGNGLGTGGGVTNVGPNGGGGGAYGGNGGRYNTSAGSNAYGSITEPSDLGSGGATHANQINYLGGNGGGAIKLNITNTLTNNGSITANGDTAPNYGGGGSGGSIWITSNTLAGSGTITANGGNNPAGQNGGGSGGRIALYYNTKTLSGNVTASGGTGSQNGAAGTVYEKVSSDEFGSLTISSNGTQGASTEINNTFYTPNTLKNLTITSGSVLVQSKPLTLQNTTFTLPSNTQYYQNQILSFTSSLTAFNLSGYWESKINPTNTSTANLTINSGGNFTTSQNTTVAANLNYKLELTFNNITINSGGQIQTNFKGYLGGFQAGNSSGIGQGTGGGITSGAGGGGGGYGGNGGKYSVATGGDSYGSITEPTDLGSGGGAYGNSASYAGGNAGGAIKLNVTNILTNNGTISTNGANGTTYGGGGSGGSIWITTNSLTGAGTLSANGGNNPSGYSGGGGGGRIALYYETKTFSGSATASGGTASSPGLTGSVGTIYEPNTPQVALADAVFSPNPNPVAVDDIFTVQITNVKNTFGFNLFSGTCSVNITGPSGYSQSYSGTVNTGVCTISGTYPAPTISGSGYTAALSVTGATTETKNVNFDVATAASNKAKLDTASLPVYTAVTVTPANPLIGTNYTISGTGFVDSGNDQALNGIPCAINITGPNSYSNTFNTSNILGGNCSYGFDSNTLPKVPGTYAVTITVEGDSNNLTTNSTNFNYYFDIYLTNGSGFDLAGKIPGTITSSQSTIVLNDPDPIFTSPIIRRYDNSTLIPTSTACAILVTIAGGSEVAYTSTTNVNGQCVVTVPNNSFTGGTLSLRNRVTIQGNDFYTNPNTSILIQNFPSNKAKADDVFATQPKITTQTSSPTPTLIGSNYTLSVTGLEDSLINARPLAGLNCSIIMTGPNGYSDTQNVAVTNGTCSRTYSGNTPQTPGQYSFKVQVAGDNSTTLETPTVNFNRFFNVRLTGGTPGISGSISGSTTSSQNPILLNTATTLTSPVIRNYADNANLTGLICRNVLKINSGSDQFYNGTLNGSGQCVTVVPSGDITALGTAYIKTQISAINADFNPAYTFENANSVLQIRNPPTSQICANETFRDDNKNGVRDGGEPLLAGVVTRLKDASNTTILNTLTTSAGGPNCFTGLFDDTYYLQQVLPTGGTLQTSSLSFQIILGVAATENRSFGYNGEAVICPSPTFIDINENGIYESGGGDFHFPGLSTDLYLTSDQNTSLEQITTNAGGTACFAPRNPGNYTIKQSPPANTTSTTGTINSGKVSQNVTLTFGVNINQRFGYRVVPSQKAKPQANPNQTKPIYTTIAQLTTVNPTYNEKAFVNYPVSANISGLVDSNTNLALNGTGICSATFDGPSFASPVTVGSLNVVAGQCVVDNSNNSSVIPTIAGSGNTVVFEVQGDTITLTSDPHTFEVFSGNVSICAIPFADYNLNGTRESNEPYLAGIEIRLYRDAGATLLDTISSNISGTACFTNRTPGIAYSVIQTAPAGTSLTTGTLSRDFTPFPETVNNFAYAYKGDSTITPSAFRDDNRNGVNNSETALNGVFTVTLRDYANNTISSNLSINGSNQFTNLLPTAVLGGNYNLQVSTGSLAITNTTNNNPATVSSLNNGSNQDVSFGYASDATICPNPTFYDYNKNGTRDGSEPNINGIATRLLLALDNSEVATLNTTGTNCFTAVIPNNYIIEQTHPIGAVLTTTSGTQSGGKITVPVTAVFGVSNTQLFGYKGDATICPSPTFQDLNKDGIKDVSEPLISGLNTVLRDLNGVTMQTLSTNGSNCFTEILAGNYQIVQTPPSNSTSTTGGTTQNVTVSAAQTLDVPFGYNGEPLVCPVVFRDDNGDGVQNNGETSLEGSTLTLKDSLDVQVGNTILSNGTVQCFNPLVIGEDYTVTATTPSGYSSTTSLTASISAVFGQRYTPTFGFNGDATVCVTNSFNDLNINGAIDGGEGSIAGLTTKIRVNGSNTDIQSLITDSNGSLCFDPLPPGQYKVLQTAPAGTGSTTGGDQIFTLTPAQSKNIIFGYSGSGAICVDLFNDIDFNGRKDAGETYIPNITTELYLQSNLVTPIDTKTTNSSTNACFTQLQGGDYQVKIVTIGYLNDNTFDTTTGGATQNVTLAEGNIYYSTQVFGYTNNPDFVKGAFRGLVYMDRNENAEYNTRGNDGVEATVYDNDIPIVEKQVDLLKDIGGGNFVLQETQITNSIGEFNFLGLDPGDYKVEIANDTGIVAVTPAPSTRTFTITTNEKTYDLYGFQYTAQICPVIYLDRNNNGIIDGTDIDLIQTNGLYVQLEYQSFGGTQIFGGGNANGILLNTANPCITKVPPRNYTFRLSGANNLASIFDSTYYSQRNPVGNPSTTIFLGNTTTPTIRYYTNAVTTLSSMYGKVWNDRPEGSSTIDLDGTDNKTGVENINGKDYDRDYDNDFPYVGYSVSLRKCGPVAGETMADLNAWNASPPTTTTDVNGDYVFTNIPTGLYAVIVNTAVPYQNQTQTFGRGYECSIWNNTFFNGLYFNGGGGIAPGSNVKYDVVYYYTPTVDAQLWIDTNRNGIQEYWENSSYYRPYSANFELSNSNGLVDTQRLRYFTNGNSNFASSVTPDNYTLNFLTDSNQSNIPNDYTLIGSTGRALTTIDGGKTIQYGFTPTTNSFINGRIFIDRDGDNNFEPDGQDGNPTNSYDNDESLANQTVELYFGNNYNQLVATTQTDAQGNYTFSGLAEGIYTIRSTNNAPSGTQCYGTNMTVNCGTSLTLGRNNSVTNNIRYNYNARLRLSSFYDTITNFVRDSEFEVDVNDGTFTLFAPDGSQVGNPVNPILFDSDYYNVSWQFSDLKPGTYTIQFNNLPSALRGYSNPDTIVIAPSQNQVRDYPLTAQTNNAINGDIFIDKQQGVNQGLNNQYNPNGGDNNLATLFDNDEALTNTEVKIIGPLGTYTTNTNSGANYSFTSLPSGKYKLFKLINNGANQVPNLTLDANNANIGNISLNSWSQTSWVRNATTNTHNTTYRYTNEISAYCYDDKDLNGQITYYPDSNTYDRRSGNCSFVIETSNGEIIPLDSATAQASDANGIYNYAFYYKSNLPPGSYTLRNTNNQSTSTVTNFARYEPSTLNYGITREASINFAQNSLNQVSRTNMFLTFSPTTNNASIIGQVYIDRNNNGIYEPNGIDNNLNTLEDNDIPLKNVLLSLSQNPANISKTTRTDEDGNYQITDLPAGIFKILADLVHK